MHFDEYGQRFRSIKMSRERGILLMRFHTDDGPLEWGHSDGPHAEFAEAFSMVASDADNRVVIMTGTGDVFSGPPADSRTFPRGSARDWETIRRNGLRLTMGLLEIDAPVIGVINGPASRHPEIPLLGDIVLASDDATIQDSAHFINHTVPGDGMNVIFPLLMGYNRGRYFLLTGQKLSATEARDLGLVAEILPRDELLIRAFELAEELARRNPLVLRYTRQLFTQPLKRALLDVLGYGLALEGLAVVDVTDHEGEAPEAEDGLPTTLGRTAAAEAHHTRET
jgi:enoyl-CoA hydratase/carnithine racemase